MAIKFEKIQPGMTLYDRHSHRLGNTTLRTIGEWRVDVLEVNTDARSALVSWNGNRAETWHAGRLCRLFDWSMDDKEKAEVVLGVWGSVIKVTKKKRVSAEGGGGNEQEH